MLALRLRPLFVGVLGSILALASVAHAQPATPAGKASVEEARAFLDQAESRLQALWIDDQRSSWVQNTFITHDTEILAAAASQKVIAATMDLAAQATRFDGLDLPPDLRRKLSLIKLSITTPAPRDPKLQGELTELGVKMQSIYGKGKYCGPDGKGKCRDLEELSKTLAESRDPQELLEAWRGWRTVSPPIRPMYQRYVELANAGARDLGYKDLGALWRSGYDMPPDAFAKEVDRLWGQVKPLYDALHCYLRAQLQKKYGKSLVPDGQPIPAHLLGNMWAQQWGNVTDLLALPASQSAIDVTALLKAKKVDEVEIVRYGERFYTSLGLDPLPATFWERSQFKKPVDHEVVCHASAWDIDYQDDLRIKMCIDVGAEDFVTVHHELGHNYYQRAYKNQPPLFRDSANDGFHEGIGDTLALSTTPEYLVKVGLLDKAPDASGDIGLLMDRALEKVAFLPFGLLIDQWRWKVFSGEIKPAEYNAAWWSLVRKYQGVMPPEARDETVFDPGAKYHVTFNVPYTRYFLADILQFQFHRALCKTAGNTGPLHRCSIYGSQAAGAKLEKMLEMGKSKPWPDALAAVTGETQMDATAIIDYFAPLKAWLDTQNKGQVCGW